MTNKPNLPSMRTWHDIGSDGDWIDYGGMWARRVSETRYHVLRFDNLEEHTGEQDAGYHCDLSEVDTENGQLQSALESCGYPIERSGKQFFEADHETPLLPLNCVAALALYGARAPLWQASGHNAHSLVRQAKSESRRLSASPEAYEQAMDRPVNAIGSTAREYAAGDMLSGVLRGVEAGDPKAELMLRLGVR
jgi:hypothetical protein